jgi:pyruvate kinase
MTLILESIEVHDSMYYYERPPLSQSDARFVSDSMCYNACRLAKRVDAKAIVAMTFSGYTAVQVSSQRPKARIYMFTANKKILGQMALVWGVTAYPYQKMVSTDHTIADIKFELTKLGQVHTGDMVVHLASMPIAEAGMTNMVKLSQV